MHPFVFLRSCHRVATTTRRGRDPCQLQAFARGSDETVESAGQTQFQPHVLLRRVLFQLAQVLVQLYFAVLLHALQPRNPRAELHVSWRQNGYT